MYFNSNKDNTNIDDEFSKKIDFKKIKYPLIIIISIFLIVLITVIIVNHNKTKNNKTIDNKITYNFSLKGEEEITIYQNDEYIEPGFIAEDSQESDLTNEVIISGNVDTSNIGTYEVNYTLKDKTLKRTINVIRKPIAATVIYLKGDITIYLEKNRKYIEPGYIVIDTYDPDIAKKVEITNNIDNTKPGTYNIIYSVTNSHGETAMAMRNVVVIGSEMDLSVNNTSYTNQPVDINVKITDYRFDYLLLPNGEKITESQYSYQVKRNGTYNFIEYSTNKKSIEKSITINNIDLELPTGSCILTIDNSSSYITVNARDNIGIKKYVYNNKEYSTSKINVSTNVTSAKITIYDIAGNTNNITCSVNNIRRSSSQSSKKSYSSSSSSSSKNNSSTQQNVVNSKMDGYIFIGDSRFVGMSSAISGIKGNNVHIVAKVSMGYNWLVKEAIPEVNSILKKHSQERFYIYSNLGVNDLSYSYASKLNSLANGDWSKHKVIFVSVTPCGGGYSKCGNVTNDNVIKLNKDQKSKLNNVYYCDIYNGIGSSNFGCNGSDCLHYNSTTYKKIYNYMINNCSF